MIHIKKSTDVAVIGAGPAGLTLAGRLAEAGMWIDDTGAATVLEMRAKARRVKARHGDLGMIVVDYLQLMTGEVWFRANVVNSLSGKVAGVQVTGSPGSLGGSSRIVIRGVNSISGNNQPLFIVDGTPIDNSNFNSVGTQRGGGGTDWGNSAADINPEIPTSHSFFSA